MSPIDMPRADAQPEQVIAFLAHQVLAMKALQKTEDEQVAAVSLRLQVESNEHVERIRRQFHEAVDGYAQDAARYRVLREHTVKVRKLGIAAKGIELDALVDGEREAINRSAN